MIFSFNILHYKVGAIKDTFECVDSILNLEYDNNIRVIIVDNGSKDQSYHLLTEKYGKYDYVEVLENKENLGFAKGNNVGYEYTVQKHNPDFLIIINNDTVISQLNFLDLVSEEFKRSNFHILGPKIITKTLVNQNPNGYLVKSLADVKRKIILKQKLLNELDKTFSLYIFKIRLKSFIRDVPIVGKQILKLKRLLKSEPSTVIDKEIRQENIQLHGSALIFSRLYTRLYDYAFYPKTFLFFEEDILFYIANRDKLKIVYNPKIEIYHKEDVSTDAVIKAEDKDRFKLKHSLDSLIVFKELIEEDSRKEGEHS